jgi:dTDP-4-dehydrorhamnose 3,5-epimerase
MKIVETELSGVVVVEPKVYGDDRGFFLEVYHSIRYGEHGVATRNGHRPADLVQLNHSHSARGILRGLHFQEPKAQGKLIWVVTGAVLDVAVDVRRGSPTFAKWVSVELSATNHRQLWIPPGFAHGFWVLSEEADCLYACTDFYAPECEHVIRWDDPDIAVEWPEGEPSLSERDAKAPLLADAPVLPAYDT